MPTDLTALINAANTVKNETGFKKNTAIRIGNLFLNLINTLGEIELTPGPNGQNAMLRTSGSMLQWKLSGAVDWTDLFDLATLAGADGDEVSLQRTATHIQWRLGTGSWVDLIPLADITGTAGANAIMTRTSTTSLEVGTGSKTFTYANAANLGWTVGMRLRATSGANFMEGVIDSVSATVVTLIVDLIGGSGTHATWNIGVAGAQGSPDTAAQIRDKINTLTGEERLAVAVLKDFVTAVVAQIQTDVPAANQHQYLTESGEISLVSKYDRKNTFEIGFGVSAIHAGEFHPTTKRVLRPIYETELNWTKTGAILKNEVVIHHTSQVPIASMIPFGPKSLRAPYADISALLAGQAGQTINQFYTVDGVTFYRFNGVRNGLISDYTTFTAVPGGEPWGTKPDWLIVQGDEYLTGINNRNIITATYHEDIKIGGTWYHDVVVASIEAIPNGNFDTSKPDLDTLLLLPFDENEQVTATTVQNISFYGSSVYTPEVVNPTLGMVYDHLGGGNYAIRRTVTDFVVNNGAWIRILMNSLGNRLLNATTQITIIAKIRFQDYSTDPSDIAVFGNINAEATQGFALSRRLVSSEGRIRLRVYDGVSLHSIDSSSGNILRGTHYYAIGVTYQWTPGTPNNTRFTKMWLKSTDAGYPLTQVLTLSTTQPLPPIFGTGQPFNLMGLFSAPGSSRLVAHAYLRLYDVARSDAQVQDELNLIDP